MGETGHELSFASLDYAAKKKLTKCDVFLAEMAAVVRWSALETVIDHFLYEDGPAQQAARISAFHNAADLLPRTIVPAVGSRRGRSAL